MAAYLQTAGCWAVSGDIRQPQPPGGGGGVGQSAGRPLSHCALPSRSATVYHSEGGGTSRTGPPDHFPHQRRTSTLRELVDEMHKHTHMYTIATSRWIWYFMFHVFSVLPFWCNVRQCYWENLMTWIDLWGARLTARQYFTIPLMLQQYVMAPSILKTPTSDLWTTHTAATVQHFFFFTPVKINQFPAIFLGIVYLLCSTMDIYFKSRLILLQFSCNKYPNTARFFIVNFQSHLAFMLLKICKVMWWILASSPVCCTH